MTLWYEQYQERLEYELRELECAGVPYEVDDKAKQDGYIVLRLIVDVGGEKIPLIVHYPDLYPYFRFHVIAPELELKHHQNPIIKNLCLLGRRTHEWNISDTIAGLLKSQLPRVLHAARSAPADIAPGEEVPQGEPYTAYYPCQPGAMLIVQSDWQIPSECDSGTLIINTEASGRGIPTAIIRGIVAEVHDENGDLVAQVDPKLKLPYTGKKLRTVWVRVPSLPATDSPDEHMTYLKERLPPKLRRAQDHAVYYDVAQKAYLDIVGALVEEETGYHEKGDGWIFTCQLKRKVKANNSAAGGRNRSKKKRGRRR